MLARTPLFIIAAMIALATGPVGFADDAAQQVLDDLFGESFSAAQRSMSRDDDVVLARQLLEATNTVSEKTPLVVLLADKAQTLAVNDPAGYPLAIEALGILIEKAPNRRDVWLKALVTVHEKRLLTAARTDQEAVASEHASTAMAATDALIAADRITDAHRLLMRARMMDARGGRHHAIPFADRLRDMAPLLRLEREMTVLKNQVESDPSNTTAATKLANIYLTEFNNPAKAAPFAGQTADTDLIAAVALAMKDPTKLTSPDLYRLGEFYESLAADMTDSPRRATIYARAAGYLDAFLAKSENATGIEALKAKVLRDRVGKELARLGGESAAIAGMPLAPGGWIDALRAFNPEKHTVSGEWKRVEKTLQVDDEDRHHAILPVTVTDGYEIKTAVTMGTHSGYLAIFLPIGKGHVRYVLDDDWKTGLEPIAGERYFRNDTLKRLSRREAKEINNIHIIVRPTAKRVTIQVTVNGKAAVEYTGEIDATGNDSYQSHPGSLGIYAVKMKLTFHSFEIRKLTGRASIMTNFSIPK